MNTNDKCTFSENLHIRQHEFEDIDCCDFNSPTYASQMVVTNRLLKFLDGPYIINIFMGMDRHLTTLFSY